jgi:hypothetical protein
MGRDYTLFSLVEGHVYFDQEGRRINVTPAEVVETAAANRCVIAGAPRRQGVGGVTVGESNERWTLFQSLIPVSSTHLAAVAQLAERRFRKA